MRVTLRRWSTWIILGALLGAVAAVLLRSREPQYDGKTLSEWLRERQRDGPGGDEEVAIRAIGTKALPFLCRWLESPDHVWERKIRDFVREHTEFECNFLDPSAERGLALTGFGILASNAAPAIPAILSVMNSGREEIRIAAMLALESVGAEDERAVTALIAKLTDPLPRVRFYAAAILGTVGRNSRRTVPALVKALDDVDPTVVGGVIVGFGQLGPEAKSAVPVLLVHTNLDALARRRLVRMLRRIEGDAAVEHLGSFRCDADATVRGTMVMELARFTNNPAAVPFLVEALNDQNDRVRMTAVTALRNFADSGSFATTALIALYNQSFLNTNGDQRQRHQIALTLLKIAPEAATNAGISASYYEGVIMGSPAGRRRHLPH